MSTVQVFIKPGQCAHAIMPHSEVCMHMRVAGKDTPFKLLGGGQSVQLYDPEDTDRPFSAPILPGEAGLFLDDARGEYYFNSDTSYAASVDTGELWPVGAWVYIRSGVGPGYLSSPRWYQVKPEWRPEYLCRREEDELSEEEANALGIYRTEE